MNIFERIEQDHEKQRKLMDILVETEGDSEDRRASFDTLSVELKAHAVAEEQVFYAILMEDERGTDKSRHSVAEHKEALDLLKELEEMPMSSSGWLTKFKKLKEDNEHHMEEEEEEVFPLAKKVLTHDALNDMENEFDKRKQAEIS